MQRLSVASLAAAAALAGSPLVDAFQIAPSPLTTSASASAATSRLFESSTKSAASEWMEKEKRLEEEMDAAAAERETAPPPAAASLGEDGEEEDEVPHFAGRWEELHGNYVLRPPDGSPPRALIHFLGGALLGAAPQLTYRYMLERLSSRGYLVVATPYQLSFDHLATCDEVIGRFEMVAPDLARREF